MQVVIHLADSRPVQLLLPSSDALAIDLLRWGRHDELCSPAYWAAQAWMWELDKLDPLALILNRSEARKLTGEADAHRALQRLFDVEGRPSSFSSSVGTER